MNLRSYCDGELRVNDCVSVSVSDYGGWSSTYEGMIIDIGDKLITVLFTDGDICSYGRSANKLSLLRARDSLAVGDKILQVLEKIENQNIKLEEQKAKINASLSRILQ